MKRRLLVIPQLPFIITSPLVFVLGFLFASWKAAWEAGVACADYVVDAEKKD